MRILIDCNNKIKLGSYADNVFHLLLSFFAQQNYNIVNTKNIREIKKTAIVDNQVIVFTRSRKSLLSFFNSIQLSSLLKKNFDLVIQVDNSSILQTHLPQILIPNNIKNVRVKNNIENTVLVLLPSLFAKQKATEIHQLADEKIRVVPDVANSIFKPVSWNEKVDIKDKFAEGREYFFVLANGKTKASFLSLLKAFSSFKKWQHSSMKLIVAGELSFTKNKDWLEKINSYRFRNDIVFANQLSEPEYARLLAGAYVFIHIPTDDEEIMPLLQAMQCETPSISFTTKSIIESTNGAAILIEKDNYEQLSEKMILLYKDEMLRNRLIEACVKQSHLYSKERVMLLLEETITACMNKQTKI